MARVYKLLGVGALTVGCKCNYFTGFWRQPSCFESLERTEFGYRERDTSDTLCWRRAGGPRPRRAARARGAAGAGIVI